LSFPRLFGRRGFFTRLLRRYLRGFRPGLHPRQTELPRGHPEFVAAWRREPDALSAAEAALAAAA